MIAWHEKTLESALAALSEQHVFKVLEAAAQDLGFQYCAYGMRTPLPVSRPKFSLHSNYSDAWQTTYGQENFLTIDPTVQHGLRSTLPLLWTEAVFAGAPEFWSAAKSHGLCVGWAQCCIDNSGSRGMLTLARSHETFTAAELDAKNEKMSWLAQVAHAAMMRFSASNKDKDGRAFGLTQRELEVLRWTADGKTSGEVADILNISERTINFHINRCVEKLGVNNKLAAAVKAAVSGLL
jgi:LuxR family transcriptional regulator, quorum-sensing system regulator SolR